MVMGGLLTRTRIIFAVVFCLIVLTQSSQYTIYILSLSLPPSLALSLSLSSPSLSLYEYID